MNKLPISIPAGHEVDWEASKSSNEIIFKKKGMSYEDVAKALFNQKQYFYTCHEGLIQEGIGRSINSPVRRIYDANNSTSSEQLEAIMELNKLCNVAKYKNGDWLPNWSDVSQKKHYHYFTGEGELFIGYVTDELHSIVFFKSKEAALEAIAILGEESIRKALTLNH